MKWMLVLMVALMSVCVLAEGNQEPTQQTVKLKLSPFYRASMNANTNYTYNVSVIPPDGMKSIVSAVVTFDAYINPTRNFFVWINGVACDTPSYTVSTTYASAGRAQLPFDCTGQLKPMAVNNVTIMVTGGAIGSSTTWLDVTYMNSPQGGVNVHGTEYIAGDLGKLFLQFLDADNSPVSNSECFVSLWYPNNTVLINNSLMSKLNNASDGIYYKNFNVPSTTGVYPASAKCYRPLTFYNTRLSNYALETFESNTWTGGTGWAECPLGDPDCQNGWDREDTVPLTFIITNGSADGPCYAGTYCAKITGSYGFIERGVSFPDGTAEINITYYWKYDGWQTNEHFDFFVFDGNWHLIDPHYRTEGASNTWIKDTYVLDASEFELDGGTVLIGWYATKDTPSTSDEFFLDNISIDVIAANISYDPNNYVYEILRGAGEVHVSNLYDSLLTQFGNITYVINSTWNSSVRTLTEFGQSWVGGTEYDVNDTKGKVMARILDPGGNLVEDANCSVSIWYPNQTMFVNASLMTQFATKGGNYHYDFTVPGIEGVYPYSVDCVKGPPTKKYYVANAFHVRDIKREVWNYGGTVSSNILTQFMQALSEFSGAILRAIS